MVVVVVVTLSVCSVYAVRSLIANAAREVGKPEFIIGSHSFFVYFVIEQYGFWKIHIVWVC